MSNNACAVWFWILIFISVVLFYGEPDLHDALVHYLMRG